MHSLFVHIAPVFFFNSTKHKSQFNRYPLSNGVDLLEKEKFLFIFYFSKKKQTRKMCDIYVNIEDRSICIHSEPFLFSNCKIQVRYVLTNQGKEEGESRMKILIMSKKKKEISYAQNIKHCS